MPGARPRRPGRFPRTRIMKLILAIIQPSKLEAVKEALSKVEVFRMTIVDVQGFGRQKGHTEVYRGHELNVQLLRKVQLQIAVNEDFVEPTVNAIMEAGRTGPEGRIGDGKIFILPLEDCMRILDLQKLTDEKWLNLFAATFEHHGHTGRWLFASRKAEPQKGDRAGDA